MSLDILDQSNDLISDIDLLLDHFDPSLVELYVREASALSNPGHNYAITHSAAGFRQDLPLNMERLNVRKAEAEEVLDGQRMQPSSEVKIRFNL